MCTEQWRMKLEFIAALFDVVASVCSLGLTSSNLDDLFATVSPIDYAFNASLFDLLLLSFLRALAMAVTGPLIRGKGQQRAAVNGRARTARVTASASSEPLLVSSIGSLLINSDLEQPDVDTQAAYPASSFSRADYRHLLWMGVAILFLFTLGLTLAVCKVVFYSREDLSKSKVTINVAVSVCLTAVFACLMFARLRTLGGRFASDLDRNFVSDSCRCGWAADSKLQRQALSAQLRGYLFSVIGENFVVRLRRLLFEALLRQDITFFDSNKIGDLTARLTSDVEVVKGTVYLQLNIFLRSSISVLGAAALMLSLSWRLTLAVFAVLPLYGLVSGAFGKFQKEISLEIQTQLGKANSAATDCFNLIRTVHSNGTVAFEVENYKSQIQHVRKLALKQAFWYGFYANASTLLSQGIVVAVLAYGSYLLGRGLISGVALTQSVFYVTFLVANLDSITYVYAGVMQAIGAGERIIDILDRKPMIAYESPRYICPPEPYKGLVELIDVSFSYTSRSGKGNNDRESKGAAGLQDVLASPRPVLKGVNLVLKPGTVTALVGPSGSGKSTIAYLLERFYDVSEGEILLDGNRIDKIDPKWYRTHTGVVSQDVGIFGRTVLENITYGLDEQDYKFEDVITAARKAHAYEFIMGLEHQFNTELGEKGVKLSGGQRQRLAIARALLKDPPVLIFDEATSALDAQSEQEVQRAIDEICKSRDRTLLIIAHRLSTVQDADTIIVLRNGVIEERGSHEELLTARGLYWLFCIMMEWIIVSAKNSKKTRGLQF
eukprot:g28015.t1